MVREIERGGKASPRHIQWSEKNLRAGITASRFKENLGRDLAEAISPAKTIAKEKIPELFRQTDVVIKALIETLDSMPANTNPDKRIRLIDQAYQTAFRTALENLRKK